MSFYRSAGLMLTTVLFCLSFVHGATHHHRHRRHDKVIARAPTATVSLVTPTLSFSGDGSFLQGSAFPCTGSGCVTATPNSSDLCPAGNETAWTDFPTAQDYTVVCDVDFSSAQNIYPFFLAASFEECMVECETYNAKKTNGRTRCEGFVFAPERLHTDNNCYLKSSPDHPFPATISLIGATRAATIIAPFTATPVGKSASLSSTRPTSFPDSAFRAGHSSPKVIRSKLHGASVNKPTTQWVYHEPATPMKLASDLLKPGINCELITQFELAGDTGPLRLNGDTLKKDLVDLSVVPHISRDGGKGGELNGQHIFTFCDTASFTTTNETHKGDMVGFASSSVAVDDGRNGIFGQPITLVDDIGQWNDDVGRMRGFSPMTHGEHSFNIALSGDGYRYAVWPGSSLIPLNKTHALQYASLVYDEVNMSTQEAIFTTIGNTLLTVFIDEEFGPAAERTVKRLFQEGEVMWGSIGGIRSWGPQGIGGMDGRVYVFGATNTGILVARTDPEKVADRDSYEYWTGNAWSSGQLSPTATSFMIEQKVMDFDLIYSPRHKTFIMVYLTPYVDNTFYYRSLQASSPIIPPYADDGHPSPDYDYVEEILKHPWSEEKVLYKTDTPPAGNYIYVGSLHAGYFGDEDITMGGTKMLLSWTEHTGEDAATPKSGYALKTADVELD